MTKISGVRATLAIQYALAEAGMPRTSTTNGGATNGWVGMQYYRGMGFSIKPSRLDESKLEWHVVISGKPHLTYEERSYWDGDEMQTSNDPVNPEVLYPRIRQVFESLGMTVHDVEKVGHQTMWDDDVDFDIRTTFPSWLEKFDPNNRIALIKEPTLVCARLAGSNPLMSSKLLPVYQLALPSGKEACGLTTEAVVALIKDTESRVKFNPALADAISLQGDTLVLKVHSFEQRIAPVSITNHWGDAVSVYVWPDPNIEVQRKYKSDCPVLIGGEMTATPSFPQLDSQYDGDGPWTLDLQAPGIKP